MDTRYKITRLRLLSPRLTRQAAVMIFLCASALWLTAVLIARLVLHAG